MNGRDVLVIYHEGKFYAMDAHCYHAGSSLENGDIEEINYKLCIVCPSHKYKITLAEGRGCTKPETPKRRTPPPAGSPRA
uniref:Rieske domain-containing protein n=1 Tax=Anguilla anguilla TaxID=7936 RepID=A0A0E9TLU1_ANGAN